MLEVGKLRLFYGNGFCLSAAAQQIVGREGVPLEAFLWFLSECVVQTNRVVPAGSLIHLFGHLEKTL